MIHKVSSLLVILVLLQTSLLVSANKLVAYRGASVQQKDGENNNHQGVRRIMSVPKGKGKGKWDGWVKKADGGKSGMKMKGKGKGKGYTSKSSKAYGKGKGIVGK